MGKLGIFGILACVAAFFVGVIFFSTLDTNDADKITVLQYPRGELKVIPEPGYYAKWFGTPTVYHKLIKINFTGEGQNIKVRFQDTSTGDASGIATFRLPLKTDDMLKIHKTYGSQSSLEQDLLVRHVTECAKSSARLITVEQHYSGGAGQMSGDFRAQVEKGVYTVDCTEDYISITDPDGSKRQKMVTKVSKKVGKDGEILRNQAPIQQYGIVVDSANIEEVDYESKVDQRLSLQKDMAAKERTARQQLKTAQQEALTAKAEGEKAIAIAKATADKEKLQAEIKAEQDSSVATINAEREASVAQINAEREVKVAMQDRLRETEVLEKDRIIAEGLKVQAESRKIAGVNALDPKFVFEQQLAAQVEIEKARWKALSTVDLPTVYQVNGGGGSAKDNTSTVGMLEQMLRTQNTVQVLNLANQAKTARNPIPVQHRAPKK